MCSKVTKCDIVHIILKFCDVMCEELPMKKLQYTVILCDLTYTMQGSVKSQQHFNFDPRHGNESVLDYQDA